MDELIKENQSLKDEIFNLKKELDKYKNPILNYYNKNKDIINKKANDRLKKLSLENPEKIKEYRKNAYLKIKEKKLREKEKDEIKTI